MALLAPLSTSEAYLHSKKFNHTRLLQSYEPPSLYLPVLV